MFLTRAWVSLPRLKRETRQLPSLAGIPGSQLSGGDYRPSPGLAPPAPAEHPRFRGGAPFAAKGSSCQGQPAAGPDYALAPKSPVTSSGFMGRGRHAPPRHRARGGGAEQQPGDPSERRHPLSVLGPPPEPELRRWPAGDTAAARTAARRLRACALRSHREPDLERQRAAAALLRMRHRSAGREDPLVTWASPRVDNEGGDGRHFGAEGWG